MVIDRVIIEIIQFIWVCIGVHILKHVLLSRMRGKSK
ncbi:hypothetical protein ES705_31873 [subsurface metagenome]